MAEMPGWADDQKRATWVALRTLRQRPKLVDHGRSGEPIYELRSVRLVLRQNADHFNRLVPCSKCGREVPGPPALTQADLTRSSHAIICKECVRTATSSAPANEPAVGGGAARPVTEPAEAPAARAVNDQKVVAVDTQLAMVMARLTELADAQRSESKQRAEADAETRSELRAALNQGLRHLRAAVATDAEGEPKAVEALEARVSQSFAGLMELVQGQRSELGALTGALEEIRSELQRVAASVETASSTPGPASSEGLADALRTEIAEAESRVARSLDAQRGELQAAVSDGLTQAHVELEALAAALSETRLEVGQAGSHPAVAEVPSDVGRRLDEITAWINAQPNAVAVVQAMRAEIAQAESRIAAALDAHWTELRLALTEGMAQAHAEVASLEERLRRAVVDLTDLVDTERQELRTEVTQEVAAVARTIEDLAGSHRDLQVTLDGVLGSTVDSEARMNALAASSDTTTGQVCDLQQSLCESVDHLTRLIEQHRTWQGAPEAKSHPASHSLLDALDRQLEEAETRLARRLSSSDPR